MVEMFCVCCVCKPQLLIVFKHSRGLETQALWSDLAFEISSFGKERGNISQRVASLVPPEFGFMDE